MKVSPEMQAMLDAEQAKAEEELRQQAEQARDDGKQRKTNGSALSDANGSDEDEVELAQLAKLSMFDYERQRKVAGERLDVRTSILDKLVAAKRVELGLVGDDDSGLQGSAVTFPDVEPWPEPVAGDQLLTDIADAIRKHVVLADHHRDIGALWVVHSYLLGCFLISPRLAIRSATRRCGKTTLLDVLACLVLRPLSTASTSAAAVFRVMEAYRPTLLIDEFDAAMNENEDLRGILNSGHRRGKPVLRTVGDQFEVRSFDVFGACVIALIGQLPGTLTDRSVAIDLKRRKADEAVEPFRLDRTERLDLLARKIARWAEDNAEAILAADPAMPNGIFNREADNLRPLLAIADVAGGEWTKRAREAALEGRDADEVDEGSQLEMLLGDIWRIFKSMPADLEGDKRVKSGKLVDELVKIEGRPWAEFGRDGKPITQNKVARMLKPKPIGIGPNLLRFPDEKDPARGYQLFQFAEAFERYLPTEGGSEPLQRYKRDKTGTSGNSEPLQPENDVTVAKSQKSNNDGQSSGVTDRAPPQVVEEPALSILVQRYISLGYYPDGRVRDLDAADADLRRELRRILPADRVQPEFERVLNVVATEDNLGPNPDPNN
jgi:putative DNA primase/helicase